TPLPLPVALPVTVLPVIFTAPVILTPVPLELPFTDALITFASPLIITPVPVFDVPLTVTPLILVEPPRTTPTPVSECPEIFPVPPLSTIVTPDALCGAVSCRAKKTPAIEPHPDIATLELVKFIVTLVDAHCLTTGLVAMPYPPDVPFIFKVPLLTF